MGSITLHIDATHNWPKAAALLASEGVQSAFLLNSNPDQIQYALDKTTGIVVVRVYDPFNEYPAIGQDFEKDIILRHNQGDFVAWLNSRDLSRFKGNKRVRFILGWNELYYSGAFYQTKQNTAMIEVSKALMQAGYGVAMFGMAADKTIQSEDCASGVWDDVIQYAIQNSEWVHIDIHEYEVGRLASQHLKSYPVSYPRSIEDPETMRQENWGAIDYGLKSDGNWHIGRVSWLLNRSRETFGKDFPWARGEFGWDYKNDGALRNYIPDYMGRYDKPQGLPSLRPLFNRLAGEFLSDKALCEEAYKDLMWMVSFDPPSCLSNALFAHNPQREWVGFNISTPAYEHLYTLLGQQKATIPMPELIPFPDLASPLWRLGTLTLEQRVNARPQPNTSLPPVKPLEIGTYANVKRFPETQAGSEYIWHAYQIGELKVWIAEQVIAGFAPNPINTNLYTVVIDGFEITGTREQIAMYERILSGLFTTILEQFKEPVKVDLAA